MAGRHVLLRGSRLQQARLAAGLILLTFVATHFINHAAGLFGIEAMEQVQTWRVAITRSWPGVVLLSSALAAHVTFGLLKLAGRHTLKMPAWEALQLTTGLLVPLLLIGHIIGTHGASALYGAQDFYYPVLSTLWPEQATQQIVLLLIVWLHAMIGMHHWLRLMPWYGKTAPWLVTLAALIPSLAIAGFVVGGRELSLELATAEARTAMFAAHNWPDADALSHLRAITGWSIGLYLLAVSAALTMPAGRMLLSLQRPRINVTYAAGPHVSGIKGATLLEISRAAGVPHTSVCGGRARCSTCRVRVEESAAALPPKELAEAVTLGTIGAPDNVRLACQMRPQGDITVARLVLPGIARRDRTPGSLEDDAAGTERHLAVMFLDIKGFTSIADRRLPYDVVFLLNRFFGAIGAAIAVEGGWVDKYMGDGLLAVFGRETGMRAGAAAALRAARRIDFALDDLNTELQGEGLPALGVGIGIHAGPMVVGRIGFADSAAITVIGATVNTASRLEGLTRTKSCQLVVSRAAADAAGWSSAGFAAEQVEVRGVAEPIEVLIARRARDIDIWQEQNG